MLVRSNTVLVAALAVSVFSHAAEKTTKPAKGKPAGARGTVVGKLACSKCNFKATEKCQTALKLGNKQFAVVAGPAGDDLFKTRCSNKLVRVAGVVTLNDGFLTVNGNKATLVKNTKAKSRATLAGKLVCSKCEFKIGKCAAGLKAGDLQILLEGDAALALHKARCSGAPKVATGVLTKIEGNAVYLKVSKIVDPKPRGKDKKKAAVATASEKK